jgi:hypothetical protein
MIHSMGLKADGTVVCWGGNSYGQCTVPAPNQDFVAIAAGGIHSMGLKSDGTVVCWGHNGYGQCDVPAPNSLFTAIDAGGEFSAGVRWDLTSVGDDEVLSPEPVVCSVSPNPFSTSVCITFVSPAILGAKLEIFDTAGRSVRSMELGNIQCGSHSLIWNGLSDQGVMLPSGIYILSLGGNGSNRLNARLVLVR